MHSNHSFFHLPHRLITQLASIMVLSIALIPALASKPGPAQTMADPTRIAGLVDSDGDGIDDNLDNCTLVANPDQRDADSDGIGSLCDPDLDQNCIVNFGDIAQFASVFLSADENADFDNSGAVNFGDYALLTNAFQTSPGPSGIPNICSARLTLSGTVPDVLNAPATVIARVDSTNNGGSIVDFSTSSAVDGSYSVTIDTLTGDDFVTLFAEGTGSQSSIHLASIAGSKFSLSIYGGNDGTVDGTEVDALNISTLTTAYAVLAEQAQGDTINDNSELFTSEHSVDASLMLRLSAVLDLLIGNPAISVPSGFGNTLEWLNNSKARDEYVIKVRVDFAAEMAAAEISSVANAPADYDALNLSGTMYLTAINNVFSTYEGAKAVFSNTGTVDFMDISLNVNAPWVVDSNGDIIITMAPPVLVATYTQTIEDPNSPGNSVVATVEDYRDQVKIGRIRAGIGTDHAVVTHRGYTTFPDYPVLGDEPYESIADSNQARVVFFVVPEFAFEALDLVTNGLATEYYHRDNQALGVSDPADGNGFDILDFSSNGTGTTRRRGFAFDWIIQNNELLVTFNNGDTNLYRYLTEAQPGVANALLSSTNNGINRTQRTFLIQPDESLAFTAANIQDKSYRHGLATTNTLLPETNLFDFVFYPANVACRNPGTTAQTWEWSIAADRVELFRDFDFEPPAENFFSNRTWQPIRQIGNQVYVIETLEFAGDEMPQPPTDAAVTPGRLNIYTLTHVAVGNTLPLITDDFFTTSAGTPINLFISDIVGNDIDFEGDEVVVRSVTSSVNGYADFGDGGFYPYAITYTPVSGFVGTDVLTYTASDFSCLGPTPNSGTISITVN